MFFDRQYLCLQVDDGKADTLLQAVLNFCQQHDLQLADKLAGIGSDGAPVMLGKKGGLAKLIQDSVSIM